MIAVPPKLRFVRRFSEISLDDVADVGGKNASLGELYRELKPTGIPVPNGFAVTADAYRSVLTRAGAWDAVRAALRALDPKNMESLASCGRRLRTTIADAPIPSEIETEICTAYRELENEYGADLAVAVRSSATAEDLPTASFAGQHDTYLNIRGEKAVLTAYRQCLASLFTDRAIHYRNDNGFDHLGVALSVCVMKMVRSDLAASGVAFTLDTESGFRDVVLVNASYGLGENIVQGAVEPDEFYVHKPTFEAGYRAVLRRKLGSKRLTMIYGDAQGPVRNTQTPPRESDRQCISDEDVLTIAQYAIAVERKYGTRAGRPLPMDLEWAKDGLDGKIYLVQARPETASSRRAIGMLEEYRIASQDARVLLTGRAVGGRIATGVARVIRDPEHLRAFQPGEILVAQTTTPDWEPIMKIASAVVTDSGGRTCHAAVVAREIGIPAIVGAENAVRTLADAGMITVSCAEGDVGKIYAGAVPFSVERSDVGELPRPKTKIMITIADPGTAFTTAQLPNDGVGLARIEFVIASEIQAHPTALAHPERVKDPAVRAELAHLTRRHAHPTDFFIERLSEGVGTIAAAFYPKPVIVRMSDFKTNEYGKLLGGADFEPFESNPMLGFRGASRYAHPAYADGFALECAAMRRVRETMGLRNVVLMIPFCRRTGEAKRVIEEMAKHGLERGKDGLEIYVMCEIPNNVLQIDAFSEFFDGFSIGSNDLTQLILGVDRDSASIAFEYEERDPGVLTMLGLAVQGAKRNGRYSGICGQAPSDYPEIAEFLVNMGIDSISLNPDSVLRTTLRVLEIERSNAC
jgi:pyruvate,water dikinase